MTESVSCRVDGHVGRITLNRPKALHALDQDMCQSILDALVMWRNENRVAMVMIEHTPGTRGFCAGGDITMLRASGMGDGVRARAFFATEYRMNTMIKVFPKPCLALMDGITMGGGVGLAVHGSHRIATERTLFAMPETGIGLFPDVGGGWFLPRLDGKLGIWLALTGARLKGADVVAAGIATHYVLSDHLDALKQRLVRSDFSQGVEAVLATIPGDFASPVGAGSFAPRQPVINHCFAGKTVGDIVIALHADGSDWALQQAETLGKKSPETVKLTLRQMQAGAACTTFAQVMRMEYRIAGRKVCSPDFAEGVRAVIIDKDHTPAWTPDALEAVSEEDIDRYFAPLGDDELSFDRVLVPATH